MPLEKMFCCVIVILFFIYAEDTGHTITKRGWWKKILCISYFIVNRVILLSHSFKEGVTCKKVTIFALIFFC